MLISRIAIISIACLSAAIAAAADPDKYPFGLRHGNARTCEDLSAPVYRPFTTFRKVKLASAFFVNPELAEKSRVLNSYEFPSFLVQNKTDELWTGLRSGKIQLLVPVLEKQGQFIPVSLQEIRSIEGGCAPSQSLSKIPAMITTLKFENKDVFRTSLNTLKPETLRYIRVVAAEDVVSGIASTSRFVSWDPAEVAPVIGDIQKPPR